MSISQLSQAPTPSGGVSGLLILQGKEYFLLAFVWLCAQTCRRNASLPAGTPLTSRLPQLTCRARGGHPDGQLRVAVLRAAAAAQPGSKRQEGLVGTKALHRDPGNSTAFSPPAISLTEL